MPKTIGILGGTFNPIHFGHLRIAEELRENLALDAIRFIPSANPPHKNQPIVTAQQRADMVSAAIAEHPNFVLDTQELAREGASYTVETLKSLRAELGQEASLCFIMGSDAFVHLETWHEWESLLDYCHIVLVSRPQDNHNPQPEISARLQLYLSEHYTENVDDLTDRPNGMIHMQAVTPLAISSSMIRQLRKQQHSIRYLTPTPVVDLISSQKLYT